MMYQRYQGRVVETDYAVPVPDPDHCQSESQGDFRAGGGDERRPDGGGCPARRRRLQARHIQGAHGRDDSFA